MVFFTKSGVPRVDFGNRFRNQWFRGTEQQNSVANSTRVILNILGNLCHRQIQVGCLTVGRANVLGNYILNMGTLHGWACLMTQKQVFLRRW